MAEQTRAKQRADETPAESAQSDDATPSQTEEEQKFTVDDLVARSADFLGHPSHVVAGALHGRKADLTLEDARGRVTDFLEGTAVKAKEA